MQYKNNSLENKVAISKASAFLPLSASNHSFGIAAFTSMERATWALEGEHIRSIYLEAVSYLITFLLH